MTLVNGEAMADLQMSDGRPLAAFIIPESFGLISEPNKIWILRILALLGLILLYFQTARQIKANKNQKVALISIAIAFCTPGFQMYVHWATTWTYLWAAAAGVFGFQVWLKGSLPGKSIGAILLAIAIMIYPPAALFYFALIVVSNIVNENRSRDLIGEMISGVKFLLISGVVAVLVIALTMTALNVQPTDRVRLVNTSEIIEKLFWFLTRPIVMGLRPFLIDGPEPFVVALSILPVLGILFWGIKSQARRLRESFMIRLGIFFVAACVPLTPILISPENQIEFRLILCFGWIIAVLAIYFLVEQLKHLFFKLSLFDLPSRVSIGTILGIMALLAVVNVNQRYTELFGDSYQRKNNFFSKSIQSCIQDNPIEYVKLLAPAEDFPLKKNLGVYSMQTDLYGPWVSVPNVELLLSEMNIQAPVEYVQNRYRGADSISASNGFCVIDLEKFRKEIVDSE